MTSNPPALRRRPATEGLRMVGPRTSAARLAIRVGPWSSSTMPVRPVPTDDLTPAEIDRLRDLLWSAFPPGEEEFSENDWQHALGGRHFVFEVDGTIVSHASVVDRTLHVAD